MKYTLIYSDYNKETGISTVTIRNKRGKEFTAVSRLHEEDLPIASSFAGCHYAEVKAYIKLLKAEVHDLSIQYKALEDLEKTFENSNDFNKKNPLFRKLRRRKHEIKHKQKRILEAIGLYKNGMFASMKKREEQIRKMGK